MEANSGSGAERASPSSKGCYKPKQRAPAGQAITSGIMTPSQTTKPRLVPMVIIGAACVACFWMGRLTEARLHQSQGTAPGQEEPDAASTLARGLSASESLRQKAAALRNSPAGGDKGPRLSNREFQKSSFAEQIDKQVIDESAHYMTIFGRLGMSGEQASNAIARIRDIHVASSLVSHSLIDFSEQRLKHDSEMRAILPAAAYQEYVDFEKAKPLKAEITIIEESLARRRLSLAGLEPVIEDALRRFQATTLEFSDGPYDGVPHPTAIPSEILPFVTEEYDRIQSAKDRLIGDLRGDIPQDLLDGLSGYFDERLNDFKARIKAASTPPKGPPMDPLADIERSKQRAGGRP